MKTFSQEIIIRLLNSPLRGCEYILSPGRTLFVVGERSSLVNDDGIPDLPSDTLFIPFEQRSVNFEVLYEESKPEAITLREFSEQSNDTREYNITCNNILQVGALVFSLRPENLSWSEEILDYPQVSAPSQEVKLQRRYTPTLFSLITISTLLVSVTIAFWLRDNSPQVNELSMLLGNKSQYFQILPGRNNIYYIAATHEQDALWAQQAIARGGNDKPAKVISSEQENERVTRWLADNYPGLQYFRLQMNDPHKPQLWVSRQRSMMSNDAFKVLGEKLMALLPYADRVGIVSIDDKYAVDQAEIELQRQALPYSRSDQTNGVTFVIEGSLDDGELLRASNLIDNYYHQWGKRYVQFAIKLKDDSVKGYSVQYGDKGYVKMSPNHWFFNNPV